MLADGSRNMTSFFEVERRLSLYLRALWGRDIKPDAFADSQSAHAHRRSAIAGDLIRLPQSLGDSADGSGLTLYRAAGARTVRGELQVGLPDRSRTAGRRTRGCT
jgi:hypothetical protein